MDDNHEESVSYSSYTSYSSNISVCSAPFKYTDPENGSDLLKFTKEMLGPEKEGDVEECQFVEHFSGMHDPGARNSSNNNLKRCDTRVFKKIVLNNLAEERENRRKTEEISESVSIKSGSTDSEEFIFGSKSMYVKEDAKTIQQKDNSSLREVLRDILRPHELPKSDKILLEDDLLKFLEKFEYLEPLVKRFTEIHCGYTTQEFKDVNEYNTPKTITSVIDVIFGIGVDVTKVLTAYYSQYSWLSKVLLGVSFLDGCVTTTNYYFASKIQAVVAWFANDLVSDNHQVFSEAYRNKTEQCVEGLTTLAEKILKYFEINADEYILDQQSTETLEKLKNVIEEVKDSTSSYNAWLYTVKGASVLSGIVSGVIGAFTGITSSYTRWSTTISVGLSALADRLSSVNATVSTFSKNMLLAELYYLCWEMVDIINDESIV